MKRLILAAALLLCGCTEDGGLDLDEQERIEYVLTGNAVDVTVTYVNDGGGISQHAANLPFRYSGTFDVGGYISITGSTYDDGIRQMTCQIIQDGDVIEQRSASGDFATTVRCEGTVH
jgi:hypothetical protein